VDVHALAEKNTKLERQVVRLRQELAHRERVYEVLVRERNELLLAKLDDEQHPLCQENRRLKLEVEGLRKTLRDYFQRFLNGQHGEVTKETLTRLLILAHPDKWSQGQPATELAHEITVQLNAWRERLGGQV
jgi:hypothetical protein